MDFIIDAINEWIKSFLIEAITGNLSNMFADVNTKVATIAGEVGKTPEQWNSGVFSMINSLSQSVIVPIAGLVIAAILSYELIHMIVEKNNMHDFDTFIFFKWIIRRESRRMSSAIPLTLSLPSSRWHRRWCSKAPE